MKRGQSLLEVILALAIFSMIAGVLASMAVGGMTALTTGGDLTRADALLMEGVEKVRSVRDGAWNAIPTPTPEVIDGRYTRDVTIIDVGIHTKNIKAKVSWESRPGITNSVERETYLSNWDSKTWIQTDWLGGAGQVIWSNPTKFDSVTPTNTIEYGYAGEIKLKNIWVREDNAMSIQPTNTQLNDVDIFDQNNAWVVGNGKKIMRYAGGSWASGTSNITPQNTSFRGVQMLTATNGWVVGNNGRIVRCLVEIVSGALRCNSDNAGSRDTGNESWNAIYMIDGSNGWTVGDKGGEAGARGAMAQYQGGVWSELPLARRPSPQNLNDVFMVGTSDGWAVGSNGVVLRWNGTSWSNISSIGSYWQGGTSPTADLLGVFMLNNSIGWIVGSQGLIYQWDGVQQKWGLLSDTGTETWYGVRALAGNDIWVIGSSGNIGHWNGSSWDIQTPAGNNVLRAIDVYQNPDTSVIGFAVGNSNTVLRLSYALSGELTSSVFDMTDASPVQVLEWNETNPCSPDCKVQIQLSVGAPGSWSGWMGPNGVVGSFFEGTTQVLLLPPISFNGSRWVRYKVTLRGPGSNTPKLEEIKINYK